MLICDIYVIFIHKQTCLYGLIIYQIYFDILYTFLYLVCTIKVCTCTIFLSGVWLYRHLWPENQIWASSGPQVPAVFGLSVSQWVSECVRVSNSNAWCLPPVFISLQVCCITGVDLHLLLLASVVFAHLHVRDISRGTIPQRDSTIRNVAYAATCGRIVAFVSSSMLARYVMFFLLNAAACSKCS